MYFSFPLCSRKCIQWTVFRCRSEFADKYAAYSASRWIFVFTHRTDQTSCRTYLHPGPHHSPLLSTAGRQTSVYPGGQPCGFDRPSCPPIPPTHSFPPTHSAPAPNHSTILITDDFQLNAILNFEFEDQFARQRTPWNYVYYIHLDLQLRSRRCDSPRFARSLPHLLDLAHSMTSRASSPAFRRVDGAASAARWTG